MKRFLAILLVLVMVIGVFASCGSSSDTGLTESDTSDASDDATPPVADQPTGDEDDDDGVSDDGATDDGKTEEEGKTDDGKTEEEGKTEDEGGKEEETPAEHTHTGGTATCQAAAVCTVCNQPYGEKNASNHTGSEAWTTTDTTHKKAYSCCGVVTVAEAAHDVDTPACGEKAHCATCGSDYGAAASHRGAKTYINKTATTHQVKYTGCGCIEDAVAHSGGTATCTLQAKCECGVYYGEFASHSGAIIYINKTDTTHQAQHSGCGCVETAEAHTGGTKYCNAQAICEDCGKSYEKAGDATHAAALGEWKITETQHYKIYSCCNEEANRGNHDTNGADGACSVCGYKASACEHTIIPGTCKTDSKCSNCGVTFEDTKNSNNHEGTLDTKWYSDENNHWKQYTCCSAKVNEAGHSGGDDDANCTTKRQCEFCTAYYGDVIADKHTADVTYISIDGTNTHKEYYPCCQKDGVVEEHAGGTATCTAFAKCDKCEAPHGKLAEHVEKTAATCQNLAICDICGQGYGELAPENHQHYSDTLSDLGNNKHGYKCACGKSVKDEVEHDFTGDGVCDCGLSCTHNELNGHICAVCGEDTPHIYAANNRCKICEYSKSDEKITIGSYPQTLVTSGAVRTALNSMSGTNNIAANWTSYGYANKMWYKDVTLNGTKYRGVYFTAYRFTDLTQKANYSNPSMQDDNGYSTSSVYWFRYEPIEWTVLKTEEGKALVYSDLIIDSQPFSNTKDATENKYSSDYAKSSVKTWLTSAFYNIAFNSASTDFILESNIIEGEENKVFLLSKDECDSIGSKAKKPTDYASSQGAFKRAADKACPGFGQWILRTKNTASTSGESVYRINPEGEVVTANTYHTSTGIVPAMWISLNEVEEHECVRNGHNCSICGKYLGHTSENSCTVCNFTKNGDTITLGMYPQTKVTDTTLTGALSEMVGTYNVPANGYTWVDYEYTSSSESSSPMYYVDVEHNGVKYRGVQILSYRHDGGDNETTYQNNYGYEKSESTIYWFKYEAISWTIINGTQADKALVLADLAIDSQRFGTNDYGCSNNNYAVSEIRAWLLEVFYDTAFNELQKEVILSMPIDLDENNNVDAEDKIFLITYEQAWNGGKPMLKKATDYARAQGIYERVVGTTDDIDENDPHYKNVQWIQRTAKLGSENAVYRMTPQGVENKTAGYSVTTVGIVPAMWVSLK